MNKSLIWWLVLGVILVISFKSILIYPQRFLTQTDIKHLSNLYSNSQYVVGSSSEGIGDDGLYAFAGYYYLIQGGDPSQVNFEHPPLGKYLIGTSIQIFNNENVINLIYFGFILLITYQISKLIIKNSIIALIPLLLLSLELHFQDHLIRSLLDLPFTLFFLLGIYFFLMAQTKSNLYYLSSLFWGMAFSTKFFPAIIFYLLMLSLVVYKYDKKNLKTYFLSTLLIPSVYILSHIMYFLNNHSFIEFLRHKKWMVDWWSGSPIIPFNIWRNIFTGWYKDSVSDIRFSEHWTFIIPTIVVLALLRFRKNLTSKSFLPTLIIYSTSIVYLLFLTFLNGGVLKFIMPIFPLLCILAVDTILLFVSDRKSLKE